VRRLILITGPRDSGKTRLVEELAQRLSRQGIKVGGVLSVAVLAGHVKTEYHLVEVPTGIRMPYAMKKNVPATPGSARGFSFSAEGLEFGCASLRRALRENPAVLIVDEAGPLEMGGAGLWGPLKEAAATFAGELVVTVRPDLVSGLRERLGAPPGKVLVFSPADCDAVLRALCP